MGSSAYEKMDEAWTEGLEHDERQSAASLRQPSKLNFAVCSVVSRRGGKRAVKCSGGASPVGIHQPRVQVLAIREQMRERDRAFALCKRDACSVVGRSSTRMAATSKLA